MVKIKKIYLDMDGVIADFTKGYKQLNNMEPREAEKNKKFDHFFDEFISAQTFANLDLMPGARELLTFLNHVYLNRSIPTEILSSTANQDRYDEISRQKNIWLQKHGISFKPNYVPGKRLKYQFATPDSVIIDDTLSVIEDWRKAGGIAIWHKDAATTLAQLKMYL
jgi:hypothetical protein